MSAVSNPPARTVWKGRSQWSVSRAICAGISGRIRAKAGGRAHLGPPLVRALADGLGVRVRVRVVVRADVRAPAGVLLAHAGRDGVFRHRVPVELGCCRCVPVELCGSHDVLWAGRVWVGFDEYGFRVSTRAMTRTPRMGRRKAGAGAKRTDVGRGLKTPARGVYVGKLLRSGSADALGNGASSSTPRPLVHSTLRNAPRGEPGAPILPPSTVNCYHGPRVLCCFRAITLGREEKRPRRCRARETQTAHDARDLHLRSRHPRFPLRHLDRGA
jgi:hypothetical protein